MSKILQIIDNKINETDEWQHAFLTINASWNCNIMATMQYHNLTSLSYTLYFVLHLIQLAKPLIEVQGSFPLGKVLINVIL